MIADGHIVPRQLAASGEAQLATITQLEAITKPVTGEEAAALVSCLGPDDCYGVAWTLLHLIETGPNPALNAKPAPDANEWHHRLCDRIVFE